MSTINNQGPYTRIVERLHQTSVKCMRWLYTLIETVMIFVCLCISIISIDL